MKKLDESGDFVMGPNSQPVLKASYRYRTLLFSEARWDGAKLGMKRSEAIKEGANYVQTVLKKRDMRKSPLEIEADARAWEKNRKYHR